MATIVVPFRPSGKSRLETDARQALAHAMLADVVAACVAVAPTIVATEPGGQGPAVAAALADVEDSPVAIVNADLPCAKPDDLELLLGAIPPSGLALVPAADGTTNALALASPSLFRALYGPGSARRFAELGPTRTLKLPNLVDDVDTAADLARLERRLGPHTRPALGALVG